MPSAEYLAKVLNDFRIIDNLPKPVRLLVHDHGAKQVVTLFRKGWEADEIAMSFEDEGILSSLE